MTLVSSRQHGSRQQKYGDQQDSQDGTQEVHPEALERTRQHPPWISEIVQVLDGTTANEDQSGNQRECGNGRDGGDPPQGREPSWLRRRTPPPLGNPPRDTSQCPQEPGESPEVLWRGEAGSLGNRPGSLAAKDDLLWADCGQKPSDAQRQTFLSKAVVDAVSVLSLFHESGTTENAQVSRDGGSAYPKPAHDLASGQLARLEIFDDLASRRISECLEYASFCGLGCNFR